MRRTPSLAAVTTVAVAIAVPAAGLAGSSTTKPTMKLVTTESFVPNRYLKQGDRFQKDVYNLKSGATIKITTDGPPHTVSVVKKSDQPKKLDAILACEGGEGVCGDISAAHGFPAGEGEPAHVIVDKGAAGFNTLGDSIYIPPGRGNGSVKLTAAKGQTLYLMCTIHPWMQAKINVK